MATIPRLHVTAPLGPATPLTLPDTAAHYLGAVLRRTPGDPVLLFNGQDGEWQARIETLTRRHITLTCERQTRQQSAEPDLWLLFAPLKRDATDLVIRAATELGVSRLIPVRTERSETARLNPDRLAAIAREAAEQCERLTLPEIAELTPLDHLLASWPSPRRLAAAIERCTNPSPIEAHAPGAGALLIGPEGGFTPRELDVLAAKPFVSAISLGPRILRAQTAAIAGLALIQGPTWPR